MDERVKELLEQLGTYYASKGEKFNGYEVYIPQYSGDPAIGFPLVVFKKGDEVRISTPEESINYLRMVNGDIAEEEEDY